MSKNDEVSVKDARELLHCLKRITYRLEMLIDAANDAMTEMQLAGLNHHILLDRLGCIGTSIEKAKVAIDKADGWVI